MLRLLSACWLIVLLLGSSASAQEPTVPKPKEKAPAEKNPKKQFTAAEPAQADDDFYFQGEYAGRVYDQARPENVGLQVVALGDGQYSAIEYRGGLPGEGWNGSSKIAYTGSRDATFLRLASPGREISVQIGVAVVRARRGLQLGALRKVQRRSPTLGERPAAGATVLFDGTSTDQFKGARMTRDGLLEQGPLTKDAFGDFRMHLEFRTPYMPYARGQARGNSGVYVQERYELQILDSFGLEPQFNDCGSLYRTCSPSVNMCYPPLSWQTYDITFTAARFNQGQKTSPAKFTVVHNGVIIHEGYEMPNKTGAGQPEGPANRPIRFQDHGNPVRYRNLWIIDDHRPTLAQSGETAS